MEAGVPRKVGLRTGYRLLRGRGRWVAVAVAVSLIGSLVGLGQPLIVREILDSAGSGPEWGVLGMLVGMFVAQAGANAFGQFLLARTGEGVVLGLRTRLIRHLLRVRIPDYDRYRTGDLIARVGNDTTTLRSVVSHGFTDLISGSIGVFGAIVLMLVLDWVLLAIVVGLVVGAVVIVRSALGGIRAASARTQTALGELTADLERALGAVRTVRACRAEEREEQRIGKRARSVYRASVRMALLQSAVGPAIGLAVNGSFLVVLLVGGMRVARGESSLPDLVSFLLYMTYLTVPLSAVFHAGAAMQEGAGALMRTDELLALPVEPASSGTDEPVRAVAGNGPALRFRDVWFSYGDKPVLRGASFEVPRRGVTALVGRSGAGKSTIFGLAERFIEPDHGTIVLPGTDESEMDRYRSRAHLGLVEQHMPLLYGTVRENLRYAAVDAPEAEMWEALAQVNLDDVVSGLPHGLDSEVGERGTSLSGGERQRLAIARSLLARPALLLLDEPTSQLDPENEAALTSTMSRIAEERAVLVIAHRPATIGTAHHVVELTDGVIRVQRGGAAAPGEAGNPERMIDCDS